MTAFWLFVALPIVLIALSFRIRPLVDRSEGDVFGAHLAAKGLFPRDDIPADPERAVVPEETEPVSFNLIRVRALKRAQRGES
ncbi:hypothetical protein [Deinococcus yavapaiensis]|uniref:Uncharacterized protein n=1 Tax=Deinococcus yavapaiensis KR-236 TaxID=694435 RepID=A0A318SB20_9DEIO|nr:hypothetical protein [Deinococcus yavapaiensis]PYE56579.1 hypothetical protein DES52_101384 [Deinococcus yavapaiensis KR-236]